VIVPVRVTERWEPPPPAGDARRRRLGALLVALGLCGIVWGVAHVLGAVGGPEQRDFAHRQTYDEVKPLVHGSMFGGLVRGLAGLALAAWGMRLRRSADV
jgi:hypothetical protein